MLYKLLVGIVAVLLWHTASLYANTDYPNLTMDSLLYNMPGTTPDKDDEDDIITTFETVFIKEVFVQSMFSNNEEDSEEGDMSGYGTYFNEIMATQLSRQLAEQDILHLKQYLKKRH